MKWHYLGNKRYVNSFRQVSSRDVSPCSITKEKGAFGVYHCLDVVCYKFTWLVSSSKSIPLEVVPALLKFSACKMILIYLLLLFSLCSCPHLSDSLPFSLFFTWKCKEIFLLGEDKKTTHSGMCH